MTPALFDQQLQRLRGRRVKRFSAGEGTGSALKLEFSPLHAEPILLSAARGIDRSLESRFSYSLLILCSWRLDSSDRVICGAWDDNSPTGPMITGLTDLVGREVLSLSLSRPAMDLEIALAGEYSFRIFCDQVNLDDSEDNYHYFFPGGSITVGVRSRILEESSDKAPGSLNSDVTPIDR